MRAMKKPVDGNLPLTLQAADLQWQEDGAPFSAQYGDVYFSRNGGLAETAHVFLDANHLQQRWLELDKQPHPGVFTIVELGFGTGLNFLSCWRLWQQTGCQRLRLHFISCEKHPLSQPALARALQQWPQLATFADELIKQYPDHSPGYHRRYCQHPASSTAAVVLDLYYGDALTLLQQQSNLKAKADAWFLDGFSPALNPELWSDELLQTIAHWSQTGTTLSSYSVTGRVVRALKALGFSVEKRPGFGPKRQMLFACFKPTSIPDQHQEQLQPSSAADSYVMTDNTDATNGRSAIVIGAGLAGATVARSLAQRGVRVTVLEQAPCIAAGASGNRQAVVQLRLNKQADALCQFHIHSYLYALRFYQRLAASADNGFAWHGCGVLTLNSAYTNTREAADYESLSATYAHYPEALLKAVDAQQAQAITGIAVQEDGLWQAAGGWINPRLCCELCLDHVLISVVTGTQVEALEKTAQGWSVRTQQQLFHADNVIVANSYAARQFEQTAFYPVSALRGQVSHVRQNSNSAKLQQIVCSQRYLAPADSSGLHCIGASYVKNSENTDLSAVEHEENLQKLGALAELMKFSPQSALQGRAGIRGASQDYIPIAGQVPDPAQPQWIYGGSQHQLSEDESVRLLDGLYISSGHGSHGTVSCPIIAEHIAALICQEASPLPQALAQVIDPARFIHRQRRRLRSQR